MYKITKNDSIVSAKGNAAQVKRQILKGNLPEGEYLFINTKGKGCFKVTYKKEKVGSDSRKNYPNGVRIKGVQSNM